MITIKKFLIPDSELRKIEEDKGKWLPSRLETGGYIFGKLFPNGLAQVTHVLDGGPKAERTSISFSGDSEYATKVKAELQKQDPEIRLLAEYHVHPWDGFPNPSGGDTEQLKMAKEKRPWEVIFLSTSNTFKIWDLEIKSSEWTGPQAGDRFFPRKIEVKEVPYQIVKTEVADQKKLLDRILKTVRHELLMEKTVLMVGGGSGGSVVAKYLGCTGIGRVIFVDNERLEVPNVIRHEGGVEDISKPKVEICKEIVEQHNPFTVVETYVFDATKEIEKLEKIAFETDLIIGTSGSVKVNNILNKISVDMKKPALYGGVFEKGVGGFVLAVKPFESACFNCLFGLTSRSYSVDKEAAQAYGLSEDELHQQQGLWIDVSFPALVLAKMAVTILEGKKLDYNLVVYNSDFEFKKLKVKRREDCSVCNFESWARKQMNEKMGRNKRTILSKLKQTLPERKDDL